jgi:VCBS repeat-containing protein
MVAFSSLEWLVDHGNGTATFAPDFDFVYHPETERTELVTVTVTDGIDIVTKEFMVTVHDVNREPEIEHFRDAFTMEIIDDTIKTINENEELVIIVEATDADDDRLTYTLIESPAGMSISNDGIIHWTPSFDDAGEYIITVLVTDEFGKRDDESFLINVQNINRPPAVRDDEVVTDEDSVIVVEVLGNDNDPDGDELVIDSFTNATNGGLVTYNGDGTFTYDPNGQFDYLSVGESAVDRFTYTVSDDNDGTATATVMITINGVNDAPIYIGEDSYAWHEDGEGEDSAQWLLRIDELFDDIENDPFIVSLEGNVNIRSEVDNEAGIITLTPAQDWHGEERVRFIADDGGEHGRTEHEVLLTVISVNDPPTLNLPHQITINEDEGFVDNLIDLFRFTFDVDNSLINLIFTLLSQSNEDVVSCDVDANRFIDCETVKDQSGSSDLTVKVEDPEGYSDEDTVRVTVNPINDPPVITSTPVRYARVGERYRYRIEAFDVDGDDIEFVPVALPAGMHITDDGLIEWTPEKKGQFIVRIAVRDDEFVSMQTYSIDVRDVRREITFNRVGVEQSVVSPGEPLIISAELTNNGDEALEDLRVSATIMDLGLRRTVGPFDLEQGERTYRRIVLDIPADAERGDYDIRIVASNDDVHHVAHRIITIN